MKRNQTKSPYYWENIIAIAVVGLFCVFGLISWIVASDYSLDLKFSEALDQGMKYKFIRFWTMFRVLDGYEGVVTFILPMVFVVAESFLLAMKKARPHGWFAHHHASFTWFYLLMAALWSVGITLESVYFFFSNQGFGRGYWYWFQTGWSYLIPGFILSLSIQLGYLWTATWYVHWKLARRHDFLANQYWKRACISLLTIGFIYIPISIFKSGLRREYLYNIRFADLLTQMQVDSPTRFAHYLNQGGVGGWDYGFNPDAYSDADLKNLFGERYFQYVQNRKVEITQFISKWNQDHPTDQISLVNKYYFNFPENSPTDLFNKPRTGWNYFDSDQTYPWYKPTGWGRWKGDNNLLKDATPHQSAFPSGHMAATFGICMTVYIFKNDPDKRIVIGRRIGFGIGLIFCLDMFFSLAVSLSHWWSDLGFTMFWLGPALATAYGVTLLGTKLLVNPFFKWVKQWKQPYQKFVTSPKVPQSRGTTYGLIKPYQENKHWRHYPKPARAVCLDSKKVSHRSVYQIGTNYPRKK